ncbi:MAG TPA: YihY/virulence factor BrkB family protein [Gaiellaceae bacterium]|nr:YihY/virulence factor BrkB family protein [Gaiellaceae bacterium]
MGIKDSIDRAQQRRRPLAVAVATAKKFSEDESSNLASMVAFWAFFSIFPLLLLGVTVLGFVPAGGTKERVLRNVASRLPLLDTSTLASLSGAWWAVLLGGVTALWSGLAVMRAAQTAFNATWEIPKRDRPGLPEQVARSLLALATIGTGLVAATVVSSFVTGEQSAVSLGWGGRLLGYAIALVLDVGLFLLAFRILTDRDVSFREVRAGALLAGIAFFVLQQISSFVVSRKLNGAESTYGNFATVITILWWFYLQAQITLLGAQLNVVLTERLHPRSLFGGPSTDADRRALEAYAQEATYAEREEVDARFADDRAPRRR